MEHSSPAQLSLIFLYLRHSGQGRGPGRLARFQSSPLSAIHRLTQTHQPPLPASSPLTTVTPPFPPLTHTSRKPLPSHREETRKRLYVTWKVVHNGLGVSVAVAALKDFYINYFSILSSSSSFVSYPSPFLLFLLYILFLFYFDYLSVLILSLSLLWIYEEERVQDDD